MKKIFALLIAMLCLVLTPRTVSAQFADDDNRILTEFIVMLQTDHSLKPLLQEIPSIKSKECLSLTLNIYLVERNTSASAEEFLLILRQNKNVKLAQFNHRVEPRSLVPNDSFFNLQWNMLNTGQTGGIVGADIDATDAWEISNDALTVNGDSIVIAIIDNCVDLYHEDMNYYTNYNEVPGNDIDDDHNGYIDDVNGWNAYLNNQNTYSPPDFHTMHCAGIAAAKGNNSVGVAGVCWGAKILPVVYGPSAIESNVVKAYDYVRTMRFLYNNSLGAQGAFIVSANTSFGVNNGNPLDYPVWCAMYDFMGQVGILSSGATANSNVDVDAVFDMPTSCPSKYMIAVTNTLQTDIRNAGSAYGKTSIDIGAPGTGIYSTTPADTYSYLTGTSMSAPHIAGAVGAMYSAACKGFIDAYYQHPDSISLLVKKYLLDGAEWLSSLNNITVTGGRLNLLRAVTNLKQFDCDSCHFNIDINKIPISCKSANDGAMAVLVESGSIFDYNILWSNGNNAPECLSMEPGFYTVIVEDPNNGCRRFSTAELHNPDSIRINSVNVIGATDSTNGNITVIASAGNEPLTYSLDGINYQQTAIFSVPTNGSYTVYVKNSTGCVVEQNIIVSDIETFRISDFGFRIFPNPADDKLSVIVPPFLVGVTKLEIFDIAGRKIYEVAPSTHNFQLTTSNFQSGVYFLRYGNSTAKFAVMH